MNVSCAWGRNLANDGMYKEQYILYNDNRWMIVTLQEVFINFFS